MHAATAFRLRDSLVPVSIAFGSGGFRTRSIAMGNGQNEGLFGVFTDRASRKRAIFANLATFPCIAHWGVLFFCRFPIGRPRQRDRDRETEMLRRKARKGHMVSRAGWSSPSSQIFDGHTHTHTHTTRAALQPSCGAKLHCLRLRLVVRLPCAVGCDDTNVHYGMNARHSPKC